MFIFIQGELFDKPENKSLGNVVRNEFVPKYDVGIETLEFEQQLDDLDNHELLHLQDTTSTGNLLSSMSDMTVNWNVLRIIAPIH